MMARSAQEHGRRKTLQQSGRAPRGHCSRRLALPSYMLRRGKGPADLVGWDSVEIRLISVKSGTTYLFGGRMPEPWPDSSTLPMSPAPSANTVGGVARIRWATCSTSSTTGVQAAIFGPQTATGHARHADEVRHVFQLRRLSAPVSLGRIRQDFGRLPPHGHGSRVPDS